MHRKKQRTNRWGKTPTPTSADPLSPLEHGLAAARLDKIIVELDAEYRHRARTGEDEIVTRLHRLQKQRSDHARSMVPPTPSISFQTESDAAASHRLVAALKEAVAARIGSGSKGAGDYAGASVGDAAGEFLSLC